MLPSTWTLTSAGNGSQLAGQLPGSSLGSFSGTARFFLRKTVTTFLAKILLVCFRTDFDLVF